MTAGGPWQIFFTAQAGRLCHQTCLAGEVWRAVPYILPCVKDDTKWLVHLDDGSRSYETSAKVT
jgi:hypothetical protein